MAQKNKAPVKLNLRLEGDIHEKLVKAAAKNHRSLQTEILYRLEQTLDPEWVPDHVMMVVKKAVENALAESESILGEAKAILKSIEVQERGAESPVVRRTVVIAGHKTSVSLEDTFWQGLEEIAGARDMTLSQILATIDSNRRDGTLASAIRAFVIDYRSQAGGQSAKPPIKKSA